MSSVADRVSVEVSRTCTPGEAAGVSVCVLAAEANTSPIAYLTFHFFNKPNLANHTSLPLSWHQLVGLDKGTTGILLDLVSFLSGLSV